MIEQIHQEAPRLFRLTLDDERRSTHRLRIGPTTSMRMGTPSIVSGYSASVVGSVEVDFHTIAVTDPGDADAHDGRLTFEDDLGPVLGARASSSPVVFMITLRMMRADFLCILATSPSPIETQKSCYSKSPGLSPPCLRYSDGDRETQGEATGLRSGLSISTSASLWLLLKRYDPHEPCHVTDTFPRRLGRGLVETNDQALTRSVNDVRYVNTRVAEPTSGIPTLPPLHAFDDLYRITVDEYERLADAGVLKDRKVELINGWLVRKMTTKPPHVVAGRRGPRSDRQPAAERLVAPRGETGSDTGF